MAFLSSKIAPPTSSETRAVFVIDGDTGPAAAIDLAKLPDHLSVEHLATESDGSGKALMQFAEVAARGMGLHEIRLKPDAVPAALAVRLGYRDGTKRIKSGRLHRAMSHLEEVGVPLWRDGWASLAQTIYFRGTWTCIALLLGFGSISLAVFSSLEVSWIHFILPALLCILAVVFALWQILLIVKAAHRTGRRTAFAMTVATAAAAVASVTMLVQDRAVPALAELWEIQTGDSELSSLTTSVSADGATLHVAGSYSMRAADDVQRALDENPGVREVVLAGPGGRAGPAYQMFNMFRKRRLATRVETECYSACTIAFLGGIERSVSPNARLGFHRTSFPGMSDNDMHESNRDDRRFLIYGARLAPEFANRIIQTPPGSIWVPTPQELLAGRVIDRVRP